MTPDLAITLVFIFVMLPFIWRLFTYPRIFLYREEKGTTQVEPVIVAVCTTFWGTHRKAYSEDSGQTFFWADSCKSADVRMSFWEIKMLERRKAFLEREGLK